MKASLATSLGLHAAILVAALVVLPNPAPHDVKPAEAIQVDITQITATTKKMAIAKNGYEDQIFVRADTSVPYGKVMEVMGLLNGAGYRKIGLVTGMPEPIVKADAN